MRIEHKGDVTYVDFEGDVLITKRDGNILTLKGGEGEVCVFNPYLRRVSAEDFKHFEGLWEI
jgi:hypothetical protein